MNHKSVSIVIPNYNGIKLLNRFLPSVIEAAKFYQGQTEIIMVDDASTEGDGEFIKNKFPEVTLVELEKNIGPLLAINEGFRVSRNQIVILLDNDVFVDKDFILPLVSHFNDEKVFGVMPGLGLLSSEPKKNGSKIFASNLALRRGFIEIHFVNLKESQQQNLIFLLGGGASAMDREKLLKIGGFDELFSPFYWEDADLSYRAWKRGWKIIYEPKSRVFHQVHSTIFREHKKRYIEKIAERNRYFLVWKNISDNKILFYHISWIPLRLIGFLLIGKWWRISSFLMALSQIRSIIAKRRIEEQKAKVSDSELFNSIF